MISRKNIDHITVPEADITLDDIPADDRAIIEKDRMLVDLAYATDHIIISMDKKVKNALERTGNEKFTHKIQWFNPCTAQPDYLEHL